ARRVGCARTAAQGKGEGPRRGAQSHFLQRIAGLHVYRAGASRFRAGAPAARTHASEQWTSFAVPVVTRGTYRRLASPGSAHAAARSDGTRDAARVRVSPQVACRRSGDVG